MIYSLKSNKYPSIFSRNISILAIKSTFVGLVLTLEIRGGGGGESLSPKHNQLFRLPYSLKCWNGGNQAKGLRDISILVKIYLFKSSPDLENEVKVTKI